MTAPVACCYCGARMRPGEVVGGPRPTDWVCEQDFGSFGSSLLPVRIEYHRKCFAMRACEASAAAVAEAPPPAVEGDPLLR